MKSQPDSRAQTGGNMSFAHMHSLEASQSLLSRISFAEIPSLDMKLIKNVVSVDFSQVFSRIRRTVPAVKATYRLCTLPKRLTLKCLWQLAKKCGLGKVH